MENTEERLRSMEDRQKGSSIKSSQEKKGQVIFLKDNNIKEMMEAQSIGSRSQVG